MVLHRGIVTGTIPGGTRLVQSSVAAELAVSTRSVRRGTHANWRPRASVRFDQRGGAVVRELCRTELEDIYEIRMMTRAGRRRPGPRGPPRGGPAPGDPAAGGDGNRDRCHPLGRAQREVPQRHRPGGQQPTAGRHPEETSGSCPPSTSRTPVLAVPDRARRANAEHERDPPCRLRHDPAAAVRRRAPPSPTAPSAPCGRSTSPRPACQHRARPVGGSSERAAPVEDSACLLNR